MVFGFLGLTYLGVPRFFRSQVLRVSGSWDLGFLILGFCGLRVRFFESFLGGIFGPYYFSMCSV